MRRVVEGREFGGKINERSLDDPNEQTIHYARMPVSERAEPARSARSAGEPDSGGEEPGSPSSQPADRRVPRPPGRAPQHRARGAQP